MPGALPVRRGSTPAESMRGHMTEHDGGLQDVVRLVGRGPSDRALLDATERLGRAVGGRATVWLADYRQTRLVAVTSTLGPLASVRDDVEDPSSVPVDDSWQGRCYASQSTLHSTDGPERVLVPLTHHGDRIGVVEVSTSQVLTPEQVEVVELVAPLLSQAVMSVGRMTDLFEWHRRNRMMTVAAELQWELLPGRSYRDTDLTVAAMLEPAYSVAGDAYDWSRDGDTLHLLVADGTGRGIPAALTTTLALSAWRNARRAGVDLADQAALTDQALYAHHEGEAFVSALLMQLDVAEGVLRVVDAGSPLLYRVREGKVQQVELDAQLPLGMFEESVYTEQVVELEPGDRLVVVSDGIHASRTRNGRDFGSWRLEQALREIQLLPAGEGARQLMRTLHEEMPEAPDSRLEDDAVALVLDWHPARRAQLPSDR